MVFERKNFEEFKQKIDNAPKMEIDLSSGLNDEQIQSRVNDGLTNKTPKRSSKTIKDIIKDNLLSFFNILLFVIGIIYIYVDVVIDKKSAFDTFRDCLFLGILLCNIVIGLIQDFRARKLCNQLIVVSNPKSLVLRNGKEIEISVDDIVLSDIVIYKSGDQIGVDGIVKEGMLEVNESLLTGESLIISKHPGDQIYSGTFVVGGHAKCQATSVGICNYAETLQDKAKEFKRPKSEIISSIRTIFRLIGSVVILFGIIMTIKFIVAYTKDTPPLVPMGDYLRGVLTSLISMIPSGMFLLTSVALSVGVINLSRKRVLVQEMYCIESLARVDTLCLDKTGTITDGTMRISSIIPLKDNSEGDLAQLIYTIVCATKDENPTAQAILKEYHRFHPLKYKTSIPFNSAYKYSAVELDNGKTVVLGAKEFLNINLKEVEEITEQYESKGLRVLIIASTNKTLNKDEKLPKLTPIGVLVLEDHIRKDASKNIKWFKDNGVTIKVISGDNARTVSYIAEQVGVENATNYISLENMSDDEVREVANKYTVFGRVTPEQKEILISSMKQIGHKVAMTGDGVNDILALKQADCSIAMASGTAAARNASHMVMLDSDFSKLPDVVGEGRRVINNLQRSCSLFLVKTVFAITTSLFFIFTRRNYPFQTPMMFLWEYIFIGIGAFLLSLQPNSGKIKNGFLDTIISNSLPAGLIQTSMTITYFVLDRCNVLPDEAFVIYSVISFTIFAFIVMCKVCWKFDTYRAIVCSLLAIVSIVLVILDFYVLRFHLEGGLFSIGDYYEKLHSYAWWVMLIVIGVHMIIYAALVYLFHRLKEKHTASIEERLERGFKNEN